MRHLDREPLVVALAIVLLLGLMALMTEGADVTVQSEHALIMTATSPITVTMSVPHEIYAFYLSGSTGKQTDGNSCTITAPPGRRMLRVVGLDWVGGKLKPVTKQESEILIVAAIDAAPVKAVPPAPVPIAPVETAPAAAALETAAAELKQAVIELKTKREAPVPRLAGVRIEMKTNPTITCPQCDAWKRDEWGGYESQGANVVEVEDRTASPVPQFRVIGATGTATKFTPGYMRNEQFEKHLRLVR